MCKMKILGQFGIVNYSWEVGVIQESMGFSLLYCLDTSRLKCINSLKPKCVDSFCIMGTMGHGYKKLSIMYNVCIMGTMGHGYKKLCMENLYSSESLWILLIFVVLFLCPKCPDTPQLTYYYPTINRYRDISEIAGTCN